MNNTKLFWTLVSFPLFVFLFELGCATIHHTKIMVEESHFQTFECPNSSLMEQISIYFIITPKTTFRNLFKGMERASASGVPVYYLYNASLGCYPITFGPVEGNLYLSGNDSFQVDVFDVMQDQVIWKTNRIAYVSGKKTPNPSNASIVELYCDDTSSCISILELAKEIHFNPNLPILLCRGTSQEWNSRSQE